MNRLSMTSKMWMATAMLCVVAFSMAGCAENDPESQIRSFLTTERGSEDAVPANLVVEGLDVESARQVGVRGDIHYFVAAYETAGVCLILVNSTTKASGSACGSDVRHLWTTSTGTGGAKVVTSADKVPDGWARLGDFLIVNPDANP